MDKKRYANRLLLVVTALTMLAGSPNLTIAKEITASSTSKLGVRESSGHSLALGNQFACAIYGANQKIYCWGKNSRGQLGHLNGHTGNESDFYATPTEVVFPAFAAPGDFIIDIVAGQSHACAITLNGAVYCWGDNQYGQLGSTDLYHPDTSNFLEPFSATPKLVNLPNSTNTNPISSEQILKLVAGKTHTCAQTNTGNLRCWGSNGGSVIGTLNSSGLTYSRNSTANSTDGKYYYSIPTGLGYGVTNVATFEDRTCAFVDTITPPATTAVKTMKCWGGVGSGNNLGDSSAATSSDTPLEVINVAPIFKSMGLTRDTQCVLQSDGTKCWGVNANGEFGNGTTTNAGTPVLVNITDPIFGFTSGVNHTCAFFDSSGAILCWGDDSLGQLGNGGALGSGQRSMTPSTIPNLVALEVQAGYNHTCAATPYGGVKCWGSNANHVISSNSDQAYSAPVFVLPDWITPPPRTNLLIKTSAMVAPSVSQPIRFNAYLNRPIELSLYAQNVNDLGAFTYKVGWDPARAQMQSVSLGGFSNSTGRSFNYLPQMPFINNTLGYARDATYSNNATPAGATGDGDLDLALLTPTATGETLLTLSEAQLAQVNGTVIPINTYNATMVVRASCMGDFDASGKVEINDVQTEAYNYNPAQQVGAPAYDLFYDLDNDTDIDIGDVQKVASRWNKLCSELSTDRVDSRPASKTAKSRMAATPASAKVQTSADGNTLIVAAQNLERVGAFEVEMAYNAKATNIVNAELGDALIGSQRQWLALPLSKNPSTGKAIFGAVSLGAGDAGLSGAGNLAKINLAALGKTSADARVLKITLLDVEGNVLATIMPTQASASADK